ncbi:hypothetical protein AB0O07_05090 [Streptomyces sp. NPDC093085]|uniref:hypothetical protein n=1 Tax=Streptomyces sp. NPDC093085 TaxID=3155068 RepID=UPI003445CB48
MGIGRRAVLYGAGGALVAAATGCGAGAFRTSTGAAPATPVARPSGPLPKTTPWRPDRADIDPAVKLRAVQVVEAIGAWRPGQGGPAAARRRVAALGAAPSLVAEAGPLLPAADEAALQVIDAQYGGILTETASVLVVCRQWTPGHAGGTTGTTVDVRLRRARPHWEVTALHPAEPGAAARSLPTAAHRVLAHSRITLPPAAEADIRSGQIHESVLRALLRLASAYRMDVSVIRSGHPLDVFGTDRPSDHPRGRAFDVWRIDGHRVVDPATSRRLVETFMRDAAAAGSYNVGGPLRIPGGAGNQFFTDATHHDHVHAGFTA